MSDLDVLWPMILVLFWSYFGLILVLFWSYFGLILVLK